MAVLGILATVVLVAIDPQQRIAEARDVGRKSDINEIAHALESFYTKNQRYPGATCTRYAASNCNSVTGGDDWIPELVAQGYLKSLPKDPVNSTFSTVWADGRSYFYFSENAAGGVPGDYFVVGTFLENQTDPVTLGNLPTRPHWPNCTSDLGFASNVYVIRSYWCEGADPEGAR